VNRIFVVFFLFALSCAFCAGYGFGTGNRHLAGACMCHGGLFALLAWILFKAQDDVAEKAEAASASVPSVGRAPAASVTQSGSGPSPLAPRHSPSTGGAA
jgi:hypothetical protein